jgi:hypothetical protein
MPRGGGALRVDELLSVALVDLLLGLPWWEVRRSRDDHAVTLEPADQGVYRGDPVRRDAHRRQVEVSAGRIRGTSLDHDDLPPVIVRAERVQCRPRTEDHIGHWHEERHEEQHEKQHASDDQGPDASTHRSTIYRRFLRFLSVEELTSDVRHRRNGECCFAARWSALVRHHYRDRYGWRQPSFRLQPARWRARTS